MNLTRREFIASLGSAGLFYAFRLTPGTDTQTGPFESPPIPPDESLCLDTPSDIDYTDWIAFGPGDKVTVFAGRTEIGQGLKTVVTAIVTQGLEISQENLTVVLGDTDLCPDDGPTSGSAATKTVGWGFWLACLKIRGDVIIRASRFLNIPAEELEFREGGVGRKGEPNKLVNPAELGHGDISFMDIDPQAKPAGKTYTDLKIPNVNAEAIVTGSLAYVGDLKKPGMLYAGWFTPPYHTRLTTLKSVDLGAVRALPGVKKAGVVQGMIAVYGERYSDVLKGLDLVQSTWSAPGRPKEMPLEEARANAKLFAVKEQQGDINAGLAASDLVVSETYTTQYIAHAPLETDIALAKMENGGNKVTVWVSTQHAAKARELIAAYLKIPRSSVHVIAQPAGGAFGGKQANPVNPEAARLAREAKAPVKLIYSRKDQFQIRSHFKAACIIEVTSGVSAAGKILARKIDSYQDVADGTRYTYDIPHVLVKAYRDPKWPISAAATRGTSYVQTCFAAESHIDVLAHRLGIDPLEFRRKNILHPALVKVLDTCAEMIGYGNNDLEQDEGIGLGIVVHGAAQLGATAAKVAVNRTSGKITVKHICAAYDIGTVINRNTALIGLRGGIAWGIGFILSEEIKLNGHRVETEYFSQYKIPRFSDIPPIDIVFLDTYAPGTGPRGCGEMPVIPTLCAIANAIYNAVGVRFYSTPITPDKVKKALGVI